MTPIELKTLCNPLGRGWQKKLASHLEVSDRTMRRKVKGDSPISKLEEAEIRRYVKRELKGRP